MEERQGTMVRHTFSQITHDILSDLAVVRDRGVLPEFWPPLSVTLNNADRAGLAHLARFLENRSLARLNEATLWSRVLFPLLMMAEQPPAEAWSGVTLRAEFSRFILEGTLDGVIGFSRSGNLRRPFLVVAEAKRRVEASDPQPQLFAELLAVAHANRLVVQTEPQELFGCYTIADIWTFVHARVEGFDADRPRLEVVLSREYAGWVEAETVLGLLKGIVARSLAAWQQYDV